MAVVRVGVDFAGDGVVDLAAEVGDPLWRDDHAGTLRRWAQAYVPDGMHAEDPAISPLFADLRGLSPIVLQSAGDDPLLPDADRLDAGARGRPVDRAPAQHRVLA